MRERGAQARQARGADGIQGPTPAPVAGVRFWRALAIGALIAATAGWTTVAVIALRPPPATVAVASPTDEPLPSDEPLPTDDASVEPIVESHEVADLEALLPASLNGTTLTRESLTGATVLGDDNWSTSVRAFLTSAGKTAADLQVSQAYDPAGSLDMSAYAFRVVGVEAAALKDAIIAAWTGDYPDLKTGSTTIGGFDVTTGDFGDGGVNSYWYARGDIVFDIDTGDPTIAEAALAALPAPGTPASPQGSPSPS